MCVYVLQLQIRLNRKSTNSHQCKKKNTTLDAFQYTIYISKLGFRVLGIGMCLKCAWSGFWWVSSKHLLSLFCVWFSAQQTKERLGASKAKRVENYMKLGGNKNVLETF